MKNYLWVIEEESVLENKDYGKFFPIGGHAFKTRKEAKASLKEYHRFFDNKARIRKYVSE